MDGIFHPGADQVFQSLDEYLLWYATIVNVTDSKGWVGVLTHRHNWITGDLQVEELLIDKLEQSGLGVIPVFDYGYW